MTKLNFRKAITYQLIAPLALGLILFSGVNGWAQNNNDMLKELQDAGIDTSTSTPSSAITAADLQAIAKEAAAPANAPAPAPAPSTTTIKLPDGTTITEAGGSSTATPSGSNSAATSADSDGLGNFGGCSADAASTQVSDDNNQTMTDLQNFNGIVQKDIAAAQSAGPSGTTLVSQLTTCQKDVASRAQVVNKQVNTVNQLMTNQVCSAMTQYSGTTVGSSILHPINAAGAAKGLSDYSQSFTTEATTLKTQFTNEFPSSNSGQSSASGSATSTTGSQSAEYQSSACQSSCSVSAPLVQACNQVASDYNNEISAIQAETTSEMVSSQTTWTALKVGMGVAAVGATVAIVKAIQNHNAADTRSKYYSDYNNGLLDANGTQTNCLLASNYLTDACQPVLINYCTKPANEGGTGCQTFNASYCALSTSNTSYCLGNSATTYCESYSSSSPACQWLASQPTSCTTNPNQQSCLTTLSDSQLSTQCSGYPNDPLCEAFTQGKVVNQSGSAAVAASTTTTTGQSFDELVSGSTTSASTAPVATTTTTTAITTDPAPSTGGLVIRTQLRGQPAPDLWGANSGTTVAALCGSSACH